MPALGPNPRPAAPPETLRLRELVEANLGFVWRTLRNLGVREADLEDETQKVFLVLSQKIDALEPCHVRSFLFGTARRVASHARRTVQRRREASIEDDLLEGNDNPERFVEQQHALELLVRILDTMPDEQREVFMLFELEELTLVEIASLTHVPQGTAASRLRRARAHFQLAVRRFESHHGGELR